MVCNSNKDVMTGEISVCKIQTTHNYLYCSISSLVLWSSFMNTDLQSSKAETMFTLLSRVSCASITSTVRLWWTEVKACWLSTAWLPSHYWRSFAIWLEISCSTLFYCAAGSSAYCLRFHRCLRYEEHIVRHRQQSPASNLLSGVVGQRLYCMSSTPMGRGCRHDSLGGSYYRYICQELAAAPWYTTAGSFSLNRPCPSAHDQRAVMKIYDNISKHQWQIPRILLGSFWFSLTCRISMYIAIASGLTVRRPDIPVMMQLH